MMACLAAAQGAASVVVRRRASRAEPSQWSAPAGRRRVNCQAISLEPRLPRPSKPAAGLDAILPPVKQDMERLDMSLRNIVGERSPMLLAAAEQIFGAGGKRVRPMLVFLVARATAQHAGMTDIVPEHRRLAEITEFVIGTYGLPPRAGVADARGNTSPLVLPLKPVPQMIHTASLVHDDVLDDCNIRRGKDTVNSKYGTRVAVLAGDFLFAQSSWLLANLNNLEVIKLISQVIADFANGEIKQATSLFDTSVTMEDYVAKSFYKTASLVAASCRSAAVFSAAGDALKADMYEYGRHVGLAFQIVDDILDFTQSAEQLGKPRGQDLASGNLTAPALFALADATVGPRLRKLINGEFRDNGALDEALSLVASSGGLDRAMALAQQEGDLARASLTQLPPGDVRRSLEWMVDYVLQRLY